jgi:hypothetical protein
MTIPPYLGWSACTPLNGDGQKDWSINLDAKSETKAVIEFEHQ